MSWHFFFSPENVKMIEDNFDSKVVKCKTFAQTDVFQLDHGAFQLKDGRSFYLIEGMIVYHIFQTKEYLEEENLMIVKDEKTDWYIWIDKRSFTVIQMDLVDDLPLNIYGDMILESNKKETPEHMICVGYDPDDPEGMILLQKGGKGLRTVWASEHTISNPVMIDDNWYSLNRSDDLDSLLSFIEENVDEIKEDFQAEECKYGLLTRNVYIDFIYEGLYYRMVPDAFDLSSHEFAFIAEGICNQLYELGCPYVKNKAERILRDC